ncbi:MAG TPA: RHS repeat-associated core domain-containing protein [Fibrobacteria bacterium]|nr:RHS repeat-associated core domain-containing protein [Fibrobacteria bacterium]
MAIYESRSTKKGISLSEVAKLSENIHLDLQMAKREPGAEMLVPSVVHWKVDHYAALLRRQGNLFLIRDPTFGEDLWISQAALDVEASGYFLVQKGKLPSGWRSVSRVEGNTVFGKGNTSASDGNGTGAGDHKSGGGGGIYTKSDDEDDEGGGGGGGEDDERPRNKVKISTIGSSGNGREGNCGPSGMPVYSFHSMLVSLNIEDIPVGTRPPRGPNALFKITYSQREANQPANFSYCNMGQKWTVSWLSYIIDNPNMLTGDVSHYPQGGGLNIYKGYQTATHAFAPESKDGSILVRVSTNPIVYERRLKSGGKEVFNVPNGSNAFPRKVFLSKIFNAVGDSLTFTYDNALRIISARDALGQVSTVAYELASDSLKITKVTDPFGRFASFQYNGSGQLKKVTDVLGIASEFRYGDGDFIDTLITPYGKTVFAKGENGTNRWLEATDALGQRERLEYKDEAEGIQASETLLPEGMYSISHYMNYRNSYFWDKKAMEHNSGDFTKAVVYHWLHTADINKTGTVLESEKKPLENRIWYNYQNQPDVYRMSDSMSIQPSIIGRVLDNDATQLYKYEYNRIGNVLKSIDPLGRETRYLYDTNMIDLISVRHKKGSSTELLDSATYNSLHLPSIIRHANGQVSQFTYNSKGQILTYKNPKGELATWTYDASGYLLKVQGAHPGDTTKYTYDGYGRVRTVTSLDGYTLRIDYDALDRTTKISYPDSTYEQFVYANLSLEKTRDRQGRWSRIFWNALQQPIAQQDPSGRITNYEWCRCGEIKSLTDPEGHKTQWLRDLQGRVTESIDAMGNASRFTYDPAIGRLKSKSDPKNQATHFQYFNDNSLKEISYSNGDHPTATVSYTYDTVYSRVSSMTDGIGTTRYKYKPASTLGALLLDSLDGPWQNDVITYSYDSLGRILNWAIDGVKESIAYDSLGRITSDTNALGVFSYGYMGQTGRLASLAFPNGQNSLLNYFGNTGDFRLQEIKNQNPGSAQISKFNYSYSPAGTIKNWIRQFGNQSPTMLDLKYDEVDQLSAASLKSTQSGSIIKSFSYTYDKAGNRLSDQEDSLTHQYSFNILNQLEKGQGGGKIRFEGSMNEPGTLNVNGKSVEVAADSTFSAVVGVNADTNLVTLVSRDFSNNADTNVYRVVLPNTGTANYSYDANGNMLGDGIHGFEYDSENRLVAVVNGSSRSEFQYDGSGRRIQILEKTNGSLISKKKFLWNGNEIAQERDSTGSTVVKRFFSQGVKIGQAKYYYTKDHLGSLREITDSTGAVIIRYDYDPFGTRVRVLGSVDADFGFTGYYYHAPSGLYLTKYREYNSKIGRWISRDPIKEKGGMNLYGYVLNNPVNYSDPLGLFTLFAGGGGTFAGGATGATAEAGFFWNDCEGFGAYSSFGNAMGGMAEAGWNFGIIGGGTGDFSGPFKNFSLTGLGGQINFHFNSDGDFVGFSGGAASGAGVAYSETETNISGTSHGSCGCP